MHTAPAKAKNTAKLLIECQSFYRIVRRKARVGFAESTGPTI